MFILFHLRNYRSFKEQSHFSMIASKDKEHLAHVFKATPKIDLLKTAAIYGANASGKSNIFMALAFMKTFVQNSSKEMQANQKIAVDQFKLSQDTDAQPTSFDIDFLQEGTVYRYGFDVDQEKVHAEWLYYAPHGKTVMLFERKEGKIKLGRQFSEGKDLIEKTRDNALFLSVVAQFNGKIAMSVLNWFSKFNVISNIDDEAFKGFTFSKLADEKFKEKVMNFLKIADLGIDSLQTKLVRLTPEHLPPVFSEELKKQFLNQEGISINTIHRRYDKDNKPLPPVAFDLITQESAGTQRMLSLSGPLIDTLENGKILFIDELDSRLHPLLTQFIVNLFNSPDTNPHNAQLVFASHNTHFFSSKFFRRDQLWITDKDRYGASSIYSLDDYKKEGTKIRKDASFEKDYLIGKYGGIPYISGEESLLTNA